MKIKKMVVYSLLALQLFTPSIVNAQTIYSNTIETMTSISPKVDDIRWQYRVINDALYKRLYNFSTNTPLSDWEPVT